jgi:hypothetical protein
MFTIPVVIFTRPTKSVQNLSQIRNQSEIDFQQKVLINSIRIIEDFSKKSVKANFGFSSLRALSAGNFSENYFESKPKVYRKRMRNVWKKFGFVGGTNLKSETILLPLRVDW